MPVKRENSSPAHSSPAILECLSQPAEVNDSLGDSIRVYGDDSTLASGDFSKVFAFSTHTFSMYRMETLLSMCVFALGIFY